jgi:predicted metalloprotease with PDZ domain
MSRYPDSTPHRSIMSTRQFALAILFASIGAGTAEAQIDYELSFDIESKTWAVEGKLTNPKGGEVEFWIPRWTAGAYHLAEFGRFVTSFEAFGADGEALGIEHESECQWVIAAEGQTEVVVRYEAQSISEAVFSDGVIDVESNRIAAGYAYVNPASLFGFVGGRQDESISLAVTLPEGWSAATALKRDDAGVFHAGSFVRFEDSPILFSPELYEWEGEAGGKPLSVVLHGKDGAEAQAITEMCVKIVTAASELMGGLPYDRYSFLYGFVPEGSGSGLEHSFSTLILMAEGMPAKYVASITAHEFFHLWCGERIHVEAIHDPDYTAPLETSSLWVNEGVTEYVTQHILLHAGLVTREEFLSGLSTGQVPQAQEPVWTNISRGASDWTAGAGLMDWVFSMYQQGPRTIFGLDLELRRATDGGIGVLDLLHHLVEEYVDQDRGFPEGGMVAIIDEVAGADAGAGEYYERYIDGPEKPDIGVTYASSAQRRQPPSNSFKTRSKRQWLIKSM